MENIQENVEAPEKIEIPISIKLFLICRALLCFIYLCAVIGPYSNPFVRIICVPFAILELLCIIFIIKRKPYAKGWAIASTAFSAVWIVEIIWLIYILCSTTVKKFWQNLENQSPSEGEQ